MTKKFTNLAVGAALVCVAASASAATITQSDSYGPSSVPFSTPLTFNPFGFYGTGGTLNSVTITLTTSATAEVDIFNFTATPQPFSNATATVPVTATGPGGASASTAPTAGPINGTAPVGLSSYPGLTATGTGTSSPAVGAYLGVVTQSIVLTVAGQNGTYSGSAAPFVFFSGSAVAGGSLSIVYNYTPVATPDGGMTLTLLGAALTGAALLKRRFIA